MFKRAFVALAASVIVATLGDEILAQDARPTPSGLEFLQGRVAEDAVTIATLLDRIKVLEAQLAKRKAEEDPPSKNKPKD